MGELRFQHDLSFGQVKGREIQADLPQIQRSLVHEAFLASETNAEGSGSQRSVGGYHEAAKDGTVIGRDGLGYREKVYHCRLLPSGGEGEGYWRVYEHQNRGKSIHVAFAHQLSRPTNGFSCHVCFTRLPRCMVSDVSLSFCIYFDRLRQNLSYVQICLIMLCITNVSYHPLACFGYSRFVFGRWLTT